MNSETTTLIDRPYQEIVDDILTAIVGGVVNEPIIFDIKTDLYKLAEPAREIRGITGTIRNKDTDIQERHAFQKQVDFVFSDRDNAVIWQEGGTWPDDDTKFYVDYFRKESRSPLTDINVGSVTRTLGEAISREIATVYQQINLAYLAGFIDTAEGKSLDLVVAILGVIRKTKDYALGLITFFRDTAIEGNITIPEGTQVSTSKGDATFVTTELRTLQRGQVRIDIPAQASEASKGNVGIVKAGDITTLAQPIAGISKITNFDATILGAEDETDQALRDRAKAVLRGLGKATLAALAQVIFEGRATLAEVWDPNSSIDKRSDPGKVVLLVESEPERFPSLRGAVEGTRAAGVETTLVARYVFFKPRIVAEINKDITAPGKVKIINEIIAALQGYVDGLTSNQPALGKEMLKAIEQVKDVKKDKFKIVDVMAWRTELGGGADTLVEAIVAAIQTAPPTGEEAMRKAIADVVKSASSLVVPTGDRIPDRSLVQGLTGQRATDTEIESGEFQVVTPTGSDKWWVVLDMELADIILKES
ncbi:MAG: baseplate J/gp47 family protein [Aulosira sp. ZfuVER01]|nr:baseplate J/gp47 family protein [Aulosira sp. ZfuVER01]MDZ7999425.1 baseplate J/gp47 family protein [Aulosira sp. DedVER01a]MDZ8055390.1 baseplate J/gp47 family protein [Aulosira sp. ZfuCHP01]